MEPKRAANWKRERFRKYMGNGVGSSYASHAYQVAEDVGLDGLRRGDAGVPAATAMGHGLDGGGVLVEGVGIADAGLVVEIEFEGGAGFGVAEFEFAGPGRSAIFVGPNLEEHELVAVVGQILEGAFAAGVVEEIGDHDDQAALGIGGNELADDGQVIGG